MLYSHFTSSRGGEATASAQLAFCQVRVMLRVSQWIKSVCSPTIVNITPCIDNFTKDWPHLPACFMSPLTKTMSTLFCSVYSQTPWNGVYTLLRRMRNLLVHNKKLKFSNENGRITIITWSLELYWLPWTPDGLTLLFNFVFRGLCQVQGFSHHFSLTLEG